MSRYRLSDKSPDASPAAPCLPTQQFGVSLDFIAENHQVWLICIIVVSSAFLNEFVACADGISTNCQPVYRLPISAGVPCDWRDFSKGSKGDKSQRIPVCHQCRRKSRVLTLQSRRRRSSGETFCCINSIVQFEMRWFWQIQIIRSSTKNWHTWWKPTEIS